MIQANSSLRDSNTARKDFQKLLVVCVWTVLIVVVSTINPYLGVTVFGLSLAGLILGVNFRWGAMSLLFLLPIDPQLEIKPGFYLYFDLLFILPVLVYLWKVAFGEFRIHWISLTFLPYVLFAIASGFWRAENLFWFSGYCVRLIIAALFMVTIAGVGRADTITSVLGVSVVPQAFYGIYQLMVDGPGSLYSLLYPHLEGQVWDERARALFFTQNNFGSYCATVSLMLLALGLKTKISRVRIACYVLASFGFLGLTCSGSRGAWLSAVAGLTLLFVYSRARFGAKVALATAVILGAFVAQSLFHAPWERVQSLDTFTVDTRTSTYLAALLLFVRHPLIGVGLTNYQVLMSSVINWDYVPAAAHNTYLQILSENGAVGFVLFFAPVCYLFYRNLKKARESTTALVSSVGLTAFFVHGLFDFQLMTAPQYLLLFAILFGLASQTVFEPATLGVGS